MKTKATKESEIERKWHLIDLKGKILGRVATDIAKLLMGKSKSYFVRNLDCGDFVVAINAKDVEVTGKKEEQKIYFRYSGYPGGLTQESMSRLRNRKPEDIIIHAVKGMLPQNRLRDKMLKRFKVFSGNEHNFNDKIKNQSSKIKSEE